MISAHKTHQNEYEFTAEDWMQVEADGYVDWDVVEASKRLETPYYVIRQACKAYEESHAKPGR